MDKEKEVQISPLQKGNTPTRHKIAFLRGIDQKIQGEGAESRKEETPLIH